MNILDARDVCRKNLNRYTLKAFYSIPEIAEPLILDAGCGTGVPDLALAEVTDGIIYCVDEDKAGLDWLRMKVDKLGLNERIRIINESIFTPSLFSFKFDIILAEGLLNMTGFGKGLSVLLNYLRDDGYLIIHDELKDDLEKRKYFSDNNLKLINSFELNEDVWWNEYYRCLETRIRETGNNELFSKEINEIKMYGDNPQDFRSVFYVLHNGNNSRH